VFILAVVTILVWTATGPLFGYSDTWQLIINTGTLCVGIRRRTLRDGL